MKAIKVLMILLVFASCKAQEIPTKIAYEVNAVCYQVGEKRSGFSVRSGQILLEAKNNGYKRGDEYLLRFEIKGNVGEILQIEVVHSQESKSQWYDDYENGKLVLKKMGYRIEKLLEWNN